MASPSITFIKGQGGLGRPLPGADFVSGMAFYVASLPSGFTTSTRIKALYAPSDAVNAGILNDSSDATGATFTYLITAAGGATDAIKITSVDTKGNIINLGTYTKVAGDSSIALLGASIAAFINSGTVTHGYSAAFATATLTVTAPKNLGIFLNTATTPIVVTITGTMTGTLTQPSGGVASKLSLWYYQISEFFRIQPKGILYVGFFAIPGSYTFTEITLLQTFANGTVRQFGIWKDSASAFSTSDLTLIDGVVKANDALYKPSSALYAADLSGTADISTLADLNTFSANKASAVIAADAGGQGYFLYLTTGKSVPSIGALLGTVAKTKVSESIAWVGQYNISNGVECEVLMFANGQLFSAVTVTDGLLDAMNSKRYIFLKKFVGLSGSFWNDSHTAILANSDYAQIENNRTIDKATRGIYTSLLPSLNSPLILNASGTLSEQTVAFLENQAGQLLDQMVRDAELSAFSVTINPAQNVLSTSTIIIAVVLVINGVARYIIVPIGFKPSIS
jgi:hypothetical protein